jgi:protein TonB
MGIRQNIFISITIHIMVIASVFILAGRIMDTSDRVHANHLMVSLFREMTVRTLAASSTHPLSGLKKKKAYKKKEGNIQEPIFNNTITTISDHEDMENKKVSENNNARTVPQLQNAGLSGEKDISPSKKENDGNNQSLTPLNKGEPGGLSVMISESQGGQDLYASIRNAIDKAKIYPLLARKRKIEGTVITGFTIDNKGLPQDIKIEKSSGYEVLDSAAVRIVRKAAPLACVKGEITIPISFRLSESHLYSRR